MITRKFRFEVYVRKDWKEVSDIEYIIINVVDVNKERRYSSEKYVEELMACKYSYIKSTGWMFKLGTGLEILKDSYECSKEDWKEILDGNVSKLLKELVI